MKEQVAINQALHGIIAMYQRCDQEYRERPRKRTEFYQDQIMELDERYSEHLEGTPEAHYLCALRLTPRRPHLKWEEAQAAWQLLEAIKVRRFMFKEDIILLESICGSNNMKICLPEADYLGALVKHFNGSDEYGTHAYMRRAKKP